MREVFDDVPPLVRAITLCVGSLCYSCSYINGLYATLLSTPVYTILYTIGTLDSNELMGLLGYLGIVLSRRQLEAAFCELDANGDGVISLREFMEWSQGAQV